MTVPSINEVTAYLTGIYELMRGDEAGLNHLDLTTSGFWRSFWALAYAIPAFCFFWILDRDVHLLQHPDAEIGAGFFVRSAAADVIGLVAALASVALAARPLGMTDRFAQWVIATNWLTLPVSYLLAAIGLAVLSVSSVGGAVPILMIASLAALVIGWRVYRSALGGDGVLAFIVLFIAEFVSIVVAVTVGP